MQKFLNNAKTGLCRYLARFQYLNRIIVRSIFTWPINYSEEWREFFWFELIKKINLTTIPPELIKILTAKSSKKESSKFTYKLSALIDWINFDEDKQNLTGIRYNPPDTLEIRKQSLAATFQLQTDSLILNFRRSGFKITSKTNDWSPVGIPPNVQLGFMAECSQNSPKVPKIEAPPSRHETKVVRAVLKAGIQTEISFIPHLRSKWKIICDNYNSEFLPIEIFLTRLADMYQVKDLSQADSYYLLSLVTFCTIPGWVNFNDFVMLFSNFGEKNAVIPKLVLLLNSNKKCGNFLRFEFYTGQKPDEKTTVYFSNGPSYGFIVLWPDGGTLEITNDFNTPFFSEFLVDSGGNRYQSWDLIVNSS